MTDFTPRTDLIALDFEDRRRLAVAQTLQVLERTEGLLVPGELGAAVLAHVTGEDEVLKMGDKVVANLNRIFGPPLG